MDKVLHEQSNLSPLIFLHNMIKKNNKTPIIETNQLSHIIIHQRSLNKQVYKNPLITITIFFII